MLKMLKLVLPVVLFACSFMTTPSQAFLSGLADRASGALKKAEKSFACNRVTCIDPKTVFDKGCLKRTDGTHQKQPNCRTSFCQVACGGDTCKKDKATYRTCHQVCHPAEIPNCEEAGARAKKKQVAAKKAAKKTAQQQRRAQR